MYVLLPDPFAPTSATILPGLAQYSAASLLWHSGQARRLVSLAHPGQAARRPGLRTEKTGGSDGGVPPRCRPSTSSARASHPPRPPEHRKATRFSATRAKQYGQVIKIHPIFMRRTGGSSSATSPSAKHRSQ
ncbi:hypothetical protein Aph01nite_38740 [Acrocarpospora phusangensis]|uniref:Uncharacterized protein n=1 Tax=Acrocarpospora phusangensis TaxID=1070424 RepID=A0A919UL18_9ACTN|nr:hypothetical protein Aph01nite_38740 [Acrocarpospora phusangensis]